ncbi:MAG: DNA primase [Gammaproteobacteria bacterium]|nr:DNA primase [Gammaproteobacteria bacterium]
MAGPIPREFIDDLLDRADITQIIGERVKLKRAGREYKGLCPFHNEKTPSFTVVPAKGFFHCFGCGAHGSALSFMMQHDRLDFPAAVEALADRYGLEVPRSGPSRPSGKGLYELLNGAALHYIEGLKASTPAKDYLKGRGLTGKIAQAFGIGYAPAGNGVLARFGQTDDDRRRLVDAGLALKGDSGEHYDRFRDRIMFPIRNRRGRVTGFGGRAMGDVQPKYMNSPETPVFHKGRELYGLHELGRRKVDRCVLVEGYMDVIGLAQHDVPGAMATLGTAVTPQQLTLLFRISPSVVFCFDGDPAGRRAAERAMERALPEMRGGRQLSFAFLPEGEDPDSYVRSEGAEAFNQVLDSATPMSEFLMQTLSAQCDLATAEGRARIAELARPLIGSTPIGVYRDLLVNRLADEVQLPRERLGQLLETSQGRRAAVRRPAPGTVRNDPWGNLAGSLAGLLLNFPEMAADADPLPEFQYLKEPRVGLLAELFETARSTPGISPVKLVERYRERPEHGLLSRLLARETELNAGQAKREFEEGVARMQRENSIREMAARTPS